MALIFCFLFWAPVFATTFDRVVAKVNNDVITLGLLEGKVKVYLNGVNASGFVDKQLSEKEVMIGVLDEMIAEKLQLQEAKKLGMVVSDPTVEIALEDVYRNNNITKDQLVDMLKNEGRDFEVYKKVIRDQIIVSRIINMEIGKVSVNKRAIKKYYIKNKKDYWIPEKMLASHIMFIKEIGAPVKESQIIKQKAEEILKQVQSGTKKFSELAKLHSEDVSAHSGGDLGIISVGTMMPEFEKAAFALKVGEVSNIVETDNGFHIIKCDKIIPGHMKEYKTVRADIERILGSKKKERKYQEWMEGLKKLSFIEISLFEDSKSRKKNRVSNSRTRGVRTEPITKVNADQNPKNKLNDKEVFSREGWVEKRLRNYKKLYMDGKISKETFSRKKKQLLEKL